MKEFDEEYKRLFIGMKITRVLLWIFTMLLLIFSFKNSDIWMIILLLWIANLFVNIVLIFKMDDLMINELMRQNGKLMKQNVDLIEMVSEGMGDE